MAPARSVIVLLCALSGLGSPAWAEDQRQHLSDLRQLDTEIQSIKQSVLDLERDMARQEDTLLYPPAQQLRLFLSMEVFDFELDSVELTLGDTTLDSHEYSAREVYALRKGGVQQLFLGNISPGVHTLKARFSGYFESDESQQPYEKSIEVSFRKDATPQWLELRIDRSAGQQLNVRVFQREASQ